jgi:hypothetical protein
LRGIIKVFVIDVKVIYFNSVYSDFDISHGGNVARLVGSYPGLSQAPGTRQVSGSGMKRISTSDRAALRQNSQHT